VSDTTPSKHKIWTMSTIGLCLAGLNSVGFVLVCTGHEADLAVDLRDGISLLRDAVGGGLCEPELPATEGVRALSVRAPMGVLTLRAASILIGICKPSCSSVVNGELHLRTPRSTCLTRRRVT